MHDSAQLRETMIASQLRVSKVGNERVIAAFRAVPRERFLPADRHALAYVDDNVPLGHGRMLMEPLAFARLVEAAEIAAGHRVLIVGAGAGYSAAVIALLAAEVVALEVQPELADIARRALADTAGVSVVTGPLAAGWAAGQPYDVIVLEGCVQHIPDTLVEQLACDGVMAGVIADRGVGRGFVGRRSGEGFGILPFMDAQVPPLPGFAIQKGFTF